MCVCVCARARVRACVRACMCGCVWVYAGLAVLLGGSPDKLDLQVCRLLNESVCDMSTRLSRDASVRTLLALLVHVLNESVCDMSTRLSRDASVRTLLALRVQQCKY